ncbi:MAG TPA: PilC/PilY family type IV pilus protein [Marinagarivorans sp.]
MQNTGRLPIVFKAFLLTLVSLGASAAPSVSDYDAVPPLLAESASPMIMLAMSNDHQLFFKSFTDYDDINGDGILDITYDNAIEYAGYFDSYKCYSYNGSLFTPKTITATKYCNNSVGATAGDLWSGNFLNWATMTRIDQVRKVLYGGYRKVDTANKTVLERSYLPSDAHSFAKYYNGEDLGLLTPFSNLTTGLSKTKDTGLTLCNTTYYHGKTLSQNVTAPPLVRAVPGNYSLWAANERYQCYYKEESNKSNGNKPEDTGIYAYSSNPTISKRATQANGSQYADYIVRVEVCTGSALLGSEDCKQYPSGNYKPVGILQTFGEDSATLWGLMTGSYQKNKSGGVLRKNIGLISDEINKDTNGTFIDAPADGGIIDTIDKLRIANYQHDPGYYNESDNCEWGTGSFIPGTTTFAEGSCTNWGNPFAELMLECYRYFAGAKPTPAFNADDSGIINGLKTQTTWKNPQDKDSACAHLNLIAFNTSTVSYDGDDLGGVSDLNTSLSAEALTKLVGDGEGITNNYYFVGESGDAKNQLCTAKQVTNLGEVKGICPGSARTEGSYKAAGIAYHARKGDLRPDLPDRQSVTTYGVTLSPALPQIVLTAPITGKQVTILPACRNSTVGGNCGLVDFKVVSQSVTDNLVSGSFYVNWEDSEQGADYDQDMNGILQYELTATQLIIRTDAFAESTTSSLGFGFVVSGTTQDGFHSISGVEGYSGYGCTNCQVDDPAAEKTFVLGASEVGGSLVKLLESPLYYAAKWGGYRDVNDNEGPDLIQEWDRKNNLTGAFGPDGLPDTYFLAVNPKELKAQLTHILVDILERTAAGTAASVVSNTGAGEGVLYQALYNPRIADTEGKSAVTWVGSLNALFLDRYGNLREDSAAPYSQLTDSDNVVRVFYDDTARHTRIQRYALGADGKPGKALGAPVDVGEIKPVWSARDALSQVNNFASQRSSYGALADTGRYILTGIDDNQDGVISSPTSVTGVNSEVTEFTADVFSDAQSNAFRLLGITGLPLDKSLQKASNIVNYIRGVEGIEGYRSRTLDFNNDGQPKPWLLGDIVHSSPVSVGRPTEAYDVTLADESYRKFRQQYQNRRQVVYVGANDGMLHAFNGGFFDAENSRYTLSRNGEKSHPLGAELWAYVPYNALPHLQWLTQPNYPHVYYVDGPVKAFDVNIFDDDAVHPGGWGTIIVASMRFGGGDYTLDPNSDIDSDPSDDITTRSSFMVFDVTDPEHPPRLITEFSHPELGFTTAEPEVIKFRSRGATGSYTNPEVNDWYLVLGSGPSGQTQATKGEALQQATSDSNAKLFAINLKTQSLQVFDTGEAEAFIGGIAATSWKQNYSDDAMYFGTVAGTAENPSGRLMRARVTSSLGTLSMTFNDLVSTINQPVSATPLIVRDTSADIWVYAGTGRFFVVADNFSRQQQTYYGVREPRNSDTREFMGDSVARGDLVDTTAIQSFTNGDIKRDGAATVRLNTGDDAETFSDLVTAVSRADGWMFDFGRERARNTTKATTSDQSLVFTEYQPSGLKCEPEGVGFIHAPHLLAGVPGSFAPLGTDASVTSGEGGELVLDSVSIGFGSPSTPHIHVRADGARAAIVQTSTGEITQQLINSSPGRGERQTWRELDISW